MVSETGNSDLRVLTLLHALGDKEELIREAARLLMAPATDEAVWSEVQTLGSDVASDHPLFDSGKSLLELRSEFVEYPQDGSRRIVVDRRKGDRRAVQRRQESDRRTDDRRATALPWLGAERRADDRRQFMRRQADLMDIQQT